MSSRFIDRGIIYWNTEQESNNFQKVLNFDVFCRDKSSVLFEYKMCWWFTYRRTSTASQDKDV